MNARTLVSGTVVGTFLVFGCNGPKDRVVHSQKQASWLAADLSAISSAELIEEPRILPQTYYAAGRLHEQQGLIDKAIIQYRQAAAVNHNYTQAYNRLGILLGRQGRHADAERALRRAVELEPDRAALRNNLGYEYALQGRWPDAEAEITNAIRLDPHFARAYVNLGMVLAKTQRFEEALEAFDAALPEADAFYNLGLMFRGQHRYVDAADAFRHVLALDPDFTAAGKQLEALAPRLALATKLEPSADMNRWAAVTDPQPTDDGDEPTQLAQTDVTEPEPGDIVVQSQGVEPSAVEPQPADEAITRWFADAASAEPPDTDEQTDADQADVLATLTSAETVAASDEAGAYEEMSYAAEFDEHDDFCPADSVDWSGFSQAELDFTPADLAAPEEAIEESTETHLVVTAADEPSSKETHTGETTDPTDSTEAGLVTTLTGAATSVSVCDERSYAVGLDDCGDPCPEDEVVWTSVAAAELDFTPADLEAPVEVVEESTETHLVATAADEPSPKETHTGETTDPADSTDADLVTTLTSAATSASVCDEKSYEEGLDDCGEPCPEDEVVWTAVAAADLDFTPAPPDPTDDSQNAKRPGRRPKADPEPSVPTRTVEVKDEATDVAPREFEPWFTGFGDVLVPLAPELAVDESVASFDPCFDVQSSSPISIRRAMLRK